MSKYEEAIQVKEKMIKIKTDFRDNYHYLQPIFFASKNGLKINPNFSKDTKKFIKEILLKYSYNESDFIKKGIFLVIQDRVQKAVDEARSEVREILNYCINK